MDDGWLVAALWIGLAVVATAIALTIVPAMIVKWRLRRDLQRRCVGKLALTYDDGPGWNLTPQLLALLQKHGAKASFFLVGFRAIRSPESCDLIKQAGHELGNHTHWHRRPWRILPWNAVRDMRQGYETMSRWMGPHAPFRPPFGKLTTWTWVASRRAKAPLCFWTHDGCDTHRVLPDPRIRASQILDSGGGVVLLHSHDRGDERQNYLLAITDELLRLAQQRGFEILTMSDLLHPMFWGKP